MSGREASVRPDREPVALEGRVVWEEDAAPRIEFEGVCGASRPVQRWIPRALMTDVERSGHQHHLIKFSIPRQLAETAGLIRSTWAG